MSIRLVVWLQFLWCRASKVVNLLRKAQAQAVLAGLVVPPFEPGHWPFVQQLSPLPFACQKLALPKIIRSRGWSV